MTKETVNYIIRNTAIALDKYENSEVILSQFLLPPV